MQKIIVSGNLGRDAEIQKLENGRNCIRFNVAASSYKKDKDGQRVSLTQWYGVSYFVNSEAILQYLQKGSKVVVCGNLDLDVFKSEKSGQMYVNSNVLASDVEIVGFVETEQAESKAAAPASLPPIENGLPVPDDMPF